FTDERYIQIDDKPVMVVIGSGDAEDARRLEQLKSVLMDSVFIIASGFANVVADNQLFDAVTDISYYPTLEETGNNVFVTDGDVDATPYAVVVSRAVARCCKEAFGSASV
ncbi:hypothetical protein, partial [Pseudomonas viridiflava]|uniref:hypothetical protein n=1 Tax=Pseudomonas viridiflava TaxID=33069 RepID=UPI0013DE9DC5